MFLAGFKHDKVIPVALTEAAGPTGTLWQTAVRYPGLSDNDPSVVTARVSANGRIEQLTLRLHRSGRSAQGDLTVQGCSGSVAG